MIMLYDHPFSPYAPKVKISLREKGLTYAAPMPGGLGAGGAAGAFVEASPRAEVPALVDGDQVLTQSVAIIEWLDETHPAPPLLPSALRRNGWQSRKAFRRTGFPCVRGLTA